MPKNVLRLGIPTLVFGRHFDCVYDKGGSRNGRVDDVYVFRTLFLNKQVRTACFTLDGQ
jgi:hypothetical protein